MSHIKLVRSEQDKKLQLDRITISIDPIAVDALHERTQQVKEQYGLQQYGAGNYLLSLMLHDPETKKIIQRRRKEEDQRGGGRNYHRETELDT